MKTQNIDSVAREVRRQFSILEGLKLPPPDEHIYLVVSVGLFLLKAEAQFLLSKKPDAPNKQARDSHGQMLPGDGFLKWLSDEFPTMGSRAALRYRTAARNVGLTSEHTQSDIESLRSAKALHGRVATRLYRKKPTPSIKRAKKDVKKSKARPRVDLKEWLSDMRPWRFSRLCDMATMGVLLMSRKDRIGDLLREFPGLHHGEMFLYMQVAENSLLNARSTFYDITRLQNGGVFKGIKPSDLFNPNPAFRGSVVAFLLRDLHKNRKA